MSIEGTLRVTIRQASPFLPWGEKRGDAYALWNAILQDLTPFSMS